MGARQKKKYFLTSNQRPLFLFRPWSCEQRRAEAAGWKGSPSKYFLSSSASAKSQPVCYAQCQRRLAGSTVWMGRQRAHHVMSWVHLSVFRYWLHCVLGWFVSFVCVFNLICRRGFICKEKPVKLNPHDEGSGIVGMLLCSQPWPEDVCLEACLRC